MGPRHGLKLLTCALAAACAPRSEPLPAAEPEAPRAASYRSPPLEATLGDAGESLETRGYAAKGETWRGFLVQQDAVVRELPLRSGACTVLLGTASPGLRELDLHVFDADGAEVAGDDLTGPHAALRYCPTQSGTYYLVARSRTGNGLFAARRFAGPTGLVVRVDDLFPEDKPLRTEECATRAPPVERLQ